MNARHYGVKIGNTPEEDDITPEQCRLFRISLEQALEGFSLDLELREEEQIYRKIVAPIRHNNQITAIFGLNIDVTDRFTAMEALRSGEKRFKAIFEESPIAIAITDLTHRRYVDVNRSVCSLSGYTKSMIIGKTTQELGLFWNPGDDARLYQMLTDTGSINAEEIQTRTATGEQRSGILFTRIIMIEKAAHAISLYQDITEQKRVEEQLKSSEESYKGIFDNAPIGIFQSSPAGHYISINNVFASIFGYASPQEMMALVHDIPRQIYADAEQRQEIITKLRSRDTLNCG
jgi:PAS domain S-box